MRAQIVNSVTSDEQLVTDYKNGNNNAMGLLHERYYKKVYHKCLSFTQNPDEAFDLAQDILLKTFSKIGTFKGESKFSTWLYATAQNHCLDYLRKRDKTNQMAFDANYDIADENIDMDEIQQKERQNDEMQKCLADMSEQAKQILLLKYQQNASIKDLQDMLHIGASAVKMRLQRARQKVMKLYNFSSGITAV